MIYQVTDEHGTHFGVFSYKAEYKGNIIYGKTVQEIEDNIKRDYENSMMYTQDIANATIEVPKLVMPVIESCSLTAEQQTRFNAVSVIPDINLDDVVNYTFEGKEGVSVAYKLYAQKHELILQGQMITDLEINEIANAQQLTDLELLMLGGK